MFCSCCSFSLKEFAHAVGAQRGPKADPFPWFKWIAGRWMRPLPLPPVLCFRQIGAYDPINSLIFLTKVMKALVRQLLLWCTSLVRTIFYGWGTWRENWSVKAMKMISQKAFGSPLSGGPCSEVLPSHRPRENHGYGYEVMVTMAAGSSWCYSGCWRWLLRRYRGHGVGGYFIISAISLMACWVSDRCTNRSCPRALMLL